MGGRLRDVLGWSGIAVLAGALVLTVPRTVGFSGHEAADGQNLSLLVWAALVLALGVGVLSLASSAYASADSPEKPGATGVLTRAAVVLDTATGQQVWRHDWTPEDLLISDPPGVSGPREGYGGEPVAVTRGGAFALADGAPVQARPQTPEGADDRLLAIDTEGAVVVRDREDDAPALLLRTDAGGEVVERTRVDRGLELWWDMGRAQALGAALAVPHIDDDDAGHQVRALSVRPLEGGETSEGAWTRVGFDGERIPEPTESWQREVEHRVLAVPGAVVSYLADPNEPGFDPAPLHGLLP
ncbi:hypothetical protein [Nocardiopsis deserti]|uniref:hypothetical protein n=1 Tax=Nocardiopsis deserti TaxID=2605988 RepID=UPI00123C1C6E|nr:hypothetical protein [Nocardiopsis deserti]